MNRRNFLVGSGLLGTASAKGKTKESGTDVTTLPKYVPPLTPYEHMSLDTVNKNLADWLGKEYPIDRYTELCNLTKSQYQRSLVRCIAGLQPSSMPTCIVWTQNTFRPQYHTSYYGAEYICICTKSIVANQSEIMEQIDRMAVGLLRNHATRTDSSLENVPWSPCTFALANPSNYERVMDVLRGRPNIIWTKRAGHNEILIATKISEYEAPMFFVPYVMNQPPFPTSRGVGKYRFGLAPHPLLAGTKNAYTRELTKPVAWKVVFE